MSDAPKMLERRIVFGARDDVRDGVHYLDENNIVWVAGKSLVLLDTQLGTQQLFSCSPSCESVTAMTVSPNRRVLAVAESGKCATIAIYLFDQNADPKLKRKKVLQVPDLGSPEYLSLCFSQDGKHLVALGGFPEWKILYWSVEKTKVLASCAAVEDTVTVSDRRHFNHCTISPNDSNLVCVSGNGTLKFFALMDNHLLPTNIGGREEEGTQFLSHVWISSERCRLIASTDNGDLLVFDNQEYQFPLPFSPSDGLSINTLISYTKGFVCGGDMGLITIFEKSESRELYRKVRTFRFSVDEGGNGNGGDARRQATAAAGLVVSREQQQNTDIPIILAFTLTPPPAEENLAFLTSTKQLYYLNLPNADFTRADDLVFQPVGQPFHSSPITGVDTCAQRPLVVTASRDGTVILWNSTTNTVELRKRFPTDIFSVAMHPSGLHLLIGFADGLKLMNLYAHDIRELKTIGIRSCGSCSFSHGGQFFAAVHSTTIHVYYTYTCELLGHLRGHNGKVKSIYFVPPDDTRLISTGTDGAVYEFNLADFHKVNDNVIKAVTYNAGVTDASTVWCAGNDRKLRQLERSKLHPTAEYDLVNASMLTMSISSAMKLLFGGCEDGTVRVFNTYLGEKLGGGTPGHAGNAADSGTKEDGSVGNGVGVLHNGRSITIESHSMHTGPVTRLALSHDEGMVVSTGDDGVVVFWDVVAPHRGVRGEVEYSNELLMDRRELEATAKIISTLTTQVADLRQRMVQQQAKRERLHEEEVVKMEREYNDEMQKQQIQIDALEAEKNEEAIRFTEYLAELEGKSGKTLAQTSEDYAAKLDSLRNRADQLRRLIAERRADFEGKAAELRREAQKQRDGEAANQQRALHEMEEAQHALTLEKERNEAETEAMCAMIEEDNDVDLIQGKENYEKRRREQEEELAMLQAANNAMLSKENLNKADLEAKLADVMEKLRQQSTLESQIEAAKRDIDALTNELRERGDTMAEKDNRIRDLKKKNQELEKFKFVLEYKIKELKAQIDPRDEEIESAKERLKQMESETEQYQHSNENLVLQIRNLRHKRAGQQREVDSLTAKKKEGEEYQARLWTELSDLYEAIDNPRKLKEMAKSLHERYTSAKPSAPVARGLASRTATDEVRDYHRERDHLEQNLANLKRKVNKDVENSRSDKNRIIAENVILVREINDLRREARSLANRAGVNRLTDPAGVSAYDIEFKREIESQQAEIARLKAMAEQMERDLQLRGVPLPKAGTQASPH